MSRRHQRPFGYPILAAQGNRCFYCDKPFNKTTRPTRDHLWPRVGGEDLNGNKVYACARCNQRKGARLPTASEVHRARKLYASIGLVLREPGMSLEERGYAE